MTGRDDACRMNGWRRMPHAKAIAPRVNANEPDLVRRRSLGPAETCDSMSKHAAKPAQAAGPPAEAAAPAECFLCLEGEGAGELVSGVCLCKGQALHLECQRRMVQTYSRLHGEESATQCRVCKAPYSNVSLEDEGERRLAVWGKRLISLVLLTTGVVLIQVFLHTANVLRSTSLDEGPPVPPVITYTRGGMQPPSPPEGSAGDVEYDPCGPGEPSARCYAHYMQVHTPWMQVDPRAALGLAWA